MERNKWLKQEIMTKMEDAGAIKPLKTDAQAAYDLQINVVFDEQKIFCRCSDGEVHELAWQELIGVAIETTDEGPFFEDVFWYLGAKDRSLRIPQSAHGLGELLTRLQKLPGFDNQVFADAMLCTENHLFVCWQKEK